MCSSDLYGVSNTGRRRTHFPEDGEITRATGTSQTIESRPRTESDTGSGREETGGRPSGVDLIATSAGNYYDGGITQKEAEEFYAKMKDTTDRQPVMYGLNSKLVKRHGVVSEEVYRIGGLYSTALEKVVYWLQKAKKALLYPPIP